MSRADWVYLNMQSNIILNHWTVLLFCAMCLVGTYCGCGCCMRIYIYVCVGPVYVCHSVRFCLPRVLFSCMHTHTHWASSATTKPKAIYANRIYEHMQCYFPDENNISLPILPTLLYMYITFAIYYRYMRICVSCHAQSSLHILAYRVVFL